VRAALDDLFGVRTRRFGEDEHLSRVAGVIQQASGVAWARVAGSDKALQCPAERVLRLAESQLTAVTGAVS
jgi:hypothetical protein